MKKYMTDQEVYFENHHQLQETLLACQKQLVEQSTIDAIKDELTLTKEELKLTKTKLYSALKENDNFKKNKSYSFQDEDNFDLHKSGISHNQVLNYLQETKNLISQSKEEQIKILKKGFFVNSTAYTRFSVKEVH